MCLKKKITGCGGKCGKGCSAVEEPEHKEQTSVQDVDWKDFRDHIATADQDGSRRWLYPKKVDGRFYKARTYVSWLLLAVMFTGPFIRINGNPLLMMNIIERRFSILGHIFWPQDMALFAVAMLIFLTSIIIFTTAFGRLWCGWTCPQTLLMEMVFRKLEYAIEGDSHQQKALDSAPFSARKILIKGTKHAVFFALSFVIGNTLYSYIIGSDALIHIIRDDPHNHLGGLGFMILFTLLFYAIFARFREQACTFICPYGRFQSAMLDENTLVVAYDHKRGEHRAAWHKDETHNHRTAEGFGDCIDCKLCVAVCPTGIDIRNGTQMECVNCTACMDACDSVMSKLGMPPGLVRHASLNSIESGQSFRFTPRLKGYVVVLTALVCVFLTLVITRPMVEVTILRAPGALFQTTQEGNIENIYTLRLVNKTSRDMPVELRLIDSKGKLSVMGGKPLLVPREQITSASLLIELSPSEIKGNHTELHIGVYSNGKKMDSIHTAFIGPRE